MLAPTHSSHQSRKYQAISKGSQLQEGTEEGNGIRTVRCKCRYQTQRHRLGGSAIISQTRLTSTKAAPHSHNLAEWTATKSDAVP